MKIEVTGDTTEREIRFTVEGAPDLDVTESWHSKPRIIRPDHATLRIVNDEILLIRVSGGLLRQDGTPSPSVRDKREFRKNGWYMRREQITNAPEWVQRLWVDAPTGVQTWLEP